MNTDWNEQASQLFKMWTEGQRAWMESLGRLSATGSQAPPTSEPSGAARLNEAMTESVDQWMATWMGMMRQAAPLAFSPEGVRKMMDPTTWAAPMPGTFDFGFERMIEGPTFATQPELQLKMLKLQQLAQQRAQDSAAYHAVVLSAWQQAGERFIKETTTPGAEPIESFRGWIDRWVKIANQALTDVHRSPKFLEAQQRVTRSVTDYRLLEREIAEAYCAMAHIPTRTEMDEVQQRVLELRREVRSLQRQLKSRESEAP